MKKESVVKFLDNLYKYFAIPLVVILFLTLFSKLFEGTVFGIISGWISVGLFVVWIAMIIYKGFAKTYGPKEIRWVLVATLVPLILSVILALSHQSESSNYCFIIGIIFFEIYAVGYIVHSIMNYDDKITNIILMSFAFVILGYITIYFSSYGYEDNTIFNSLIAVFSAIIGGSLTLGGVAWTIKHQKEEKRKEELLKIKPYFSFNVLSKQPKNLENVKVCFPEELEVQYPLSVCGEIENSNSSIMILNRIYHDHKWFNLECNNTLIQSGKLIINFKFEDPNNVFLEVSDVIGTKYYYKLDLLHVALLGGKEFGLHTIRGVKEIDRNIIQKEEK